MKKISLIYLFLVSFVMVDGQETTTQSDTLRKDALNVFMQANDFIRK